jgi:hypothetical protein
MPNMNLVSHPLARLTLCVCFVAVPLTLHAQNQVASPSPIPAAKPGPSNAKPQYTDAQIQEMVSRLKDRIGVAADQVIGRIQKEETDLRIKYSYLRKPERLDPNTYASRDEITQWQQAVQQLKEKEDLLERLYADADQDLGNALTQQKINQTVAEQVKNALLKSFPWNTIKKKNELMREFIAENFTLLTFYDKNWGTWKSGPEKGTAMFEDQQLASNYQNLKEKINATGLQIEDQYKAMVQ